MKKSLLGKWEIAMSDDSAEKEVWMFRADDVLVRESEGGIQHEVRYEVKADGREEHPQLVLGGNRLLTVLLLTDKSVSLEEAGSDVGESKLLVGVRLD